MKCIIVYFSQTGNTEKIAKAIQAGVKQASGHCDIVKIKDANPRRLYEYDLIGLGSAVFGVDNFWNFIKNMRFVGKKHAFLFCTHGSATGGGGFFPNAYKRLKDRGMTLIGTADWYGDCSLLHMPEPYPTAGHPDEIDLKEAEDFGREIVVRSWRIATGETELIPPEPVEMKLPIPPGSLKAIGSVIFKYPEMITYHKEKCLYPGCRLCMDNCPMDGIDLSVEPPVISKPCLSCEWCARICPTGALDIDAWVEAMAKTTAEIMPKAMLSFLETAEAEGRFRRLVQIENFAEYCTKLHNKHPQWVIGKGAQ
jgi:flavodoxin/ferredoxin